MAKVFLKKVPATCCCEGCYFLSKPDEQMCPADSCEDIIYVRFHPTPEEAARLEAKHENKA